MSDRRLGVKFYRYTDPTAGEPYWRWFDAVTVPRVGEFVLQPRALVGYRVLSVTWVEVNEVNVIVRAI